MSYDEKLVGGLSDGLLNLMFSFSDDHEDSNGTDEKNDNNSHQAGGDSKKNRNVIIRLEAIKLVAGFTNKDKIQKKIIQKLLRNSLDFMINRYAKIEFLPLEYVEIAKQNNCLEILIKGFLKKFGGYVLSSEVIAEINNFIESIYSNGDLEIVYERVAKIQKFIHKKIDEKHGKGECSNLPMVHMRNLLSASRLHLNIYDIEYEDVNYLANLNGKSKKTSDAEMINPKEIFLPKGKKYIKNWHVRHMRPLMYFNEIYFRDKIQRISCLDKDLPINEFKRTIIEIYSE